MTESSSTRSLLYVIKLIRRKISQSRIRTILLFLVGFHLLVLTAALCFLTYRQYKDGLAQISQTAHLLRDSSINETNKFIQNTRAILVSLSTHPEIQALEPVNCALTLVDLYNTHPAYANLLVLSKKGKVVCSAKTIKTGGDVGPDPTYYFDETVRTQQFTIGKPARGFITNRWVSTFAQPIRDHGGEFIGVLGIAVDLHRFNPFPSSLNTPPGTYSGIINRSGTILASSKDAELLVGTTTAQPALDQFSERSSETFETVDYRGHKRLLSMGRIAGTDWLFFVSLDKDAVLDPIIRFAWRRLFFIFLMLLVLTYFSVWITRIITRPVESITDVLDRLTAGKSEWRAFPSGPSDIRRIAFKLNEMLDARQLASQQLQQSESRFRTAFKTSPDSVAITRLDDGRFMDVNDGFFPRSGWTKEDIIGKTTLELNIWRWPHEREKFVQIIKEKGECTNYEAEFVAKNGQVWPGSISAHLIEIEGVQTILSITRDLTELKKSQDLINTLSFFDELTGVPNRRLFMDRLQQSIAAGIRSKTFGVLAYLDIDHFKNVNETVGHEGGDAILREVALRLQKNLNPGDSLARINGDEFVVLMTDIDKKSIVANAKSRQACENMRLNMAQPFLLGNTECNLTVSIGITLLDIEQDDATQALRRAELAMHHVKAIGRNATSLFSPSMLMASSKNAHMLEDLRKAISKDQLILYYQPQVDRSGHVVGAEALLRWHLPNQGFISPSQFIPLAEDSGLIIPLGRWVLNAACQQIQKWSQIPSLSHVTVAVNVSARQFHQEDFVDQILLALSRNNVRPDRLKIELTENIMISDLGSVSSKMNQLKIAGVTFSLDDFGTGYSSLGYLKRLPFDQIKIDQSFVRDILNNTSDTAITTMIINLALNMNLSLIAEGVETKSHVDLLADLGCLHFQGYYFSKPLSSTDFESFFSSSVGHA